MGEKKGGIHLVTNYYRLFPENTRRGFFYLFREFSGVWENEQTGLRKTDKEQPDLKIFE